MKIGDYVWCKYQATANSVGVFSDFAIKTDEEVGNSIIPPTSSNVPSGYFKFICVDEYNKKKVLIADRNIQHSITWDTLNSAGIASGSGLPVNLNMSSRYNTSIRLLTGGINATDKDNEYDKYVVSSTLNGNITAGDDNIWNVLTSSCWTSSTGTTSSENRVAKRIKSVWVNVPTNTAINGYVFRPVLIIEDTLTTHTFIKSNNQYKAFKNNQWNNVSTTLPSESIFVSDGMQSLAVLDRKEKKFTQNMSNNGVLSEGKVFKSSINLKKMFEVRKIEIE